MTGHRDFNEDVTDSLDARMQAFAFVSDNNH
jgi:hypothetical protein